MFQICWYIHTFPCLGIARETDLFRSSYLKSRNCYFSIFPNYFGHFHSLKIKIETFGSFRRTRKIIQVTYMLCQLISLKQEKNELRIQKLDLESPRNHKTPTVDHLSYKHYVSLIEENS